MAEKGKGFSWFFWILLIVILGYVIALVMPEDTAPTSGLPQNTENTQALSGDPMIGTWQSTEDSKFTRQFNADGTVVDAYQNDASATMFGTWMVVDPAKEPQDTLNVPADSLAGMTVLKITFSNGDIMYFDVNKLTETSLTLTYLGRGNVLTFIKMK